MQTDSGHVGQIVFREPMLLKRASDVWEERERDQTTPLTLSASLWAGAASPSLMVAQFGLDPNRLPTNFLAIDVQFIPNQSVWFSDREDDAAPFPLDPSRRRLQRSLEQPQLTDGTAADWLAHAFAELKPRVEEVCDDEAMRAWLLDHARSMPDNFFHLRVAVVLTRALSRDDEVPGLLDEAEAAWLLSGSRAFDRSDDWINWSHKKFAAALAAMPRA